MLGALAVGETVIHGLLEGEDVLRTAAALRALGAEIDRDAEAVWRVWGRGLGGLTAPEDVLDLGNSGTGARLLLGLLAGHPLTATLTGDASLRARPMGRVIGPLEEMGARIVASEGGRLPLTIVGASSPSPIRYRLPVASAQVKSAILFAALSAPGRTTVIEPEPTRDHSELMLGHFGASIEIERSEEGRAVTLCGPELDLSQVGLASFGLDHRLSHRPRELSGGERQRVAIARALMNGPRVLLADEPTGNLDESTGAEILDLIAAQHARGLTIVMVTHDPAIAARCNRIVHLQNGRVASA